MYHLLSERVHCSLFVKVCLGCAVLCCVLLSFKQIRNKITIYTEKNVENCIKKRKINIIRALVKPRCHFKFWCQWVKSVLNGGRIHSHVIPKFDGQSYCIWLWHSLIVWNIFQTWFWYYYFLFRRFCVLGSRSERFPIVIHSWRPAYESCEKLSFIDVVASNWSLFLSQRIR